MEELLGSIKGFHFPSKFCSSFTVLCNPYVQQAIYQLNDGVNVCLSEIDLFSGVLFRMVDAFEEKIGSAVENAITKNLKEGILKLDSFLQALPKVVLVDDQASLNVTFVDNPVLSSSSIGFDINGLFTAMENFLFPYHHKNLQPSLLCPDQSKMLGISLDEAVFKHLKYIITPFLNTSNIKYFHPKIYLCDNS